MLIIDFYRENYNFRLLLKIPFDDNLRKEKGNIAKIIPLSHLIGLLRKINVANKGHRFFLSLAIIARLRRVKHLTYITN